MPGSIRVGTFNVENLFARFRFKGKRERYRKADGSSGYRYREYTEEETREAVRNGWLVDETKFVVNSEEDKKITAQTIRELDAHVLALQEVENLDVLKRFNAQYLADMGYKWRLVVDGNDPRLIDVALLSRLPIGAIRTHQYLRSSGGRSYVFSRDCLEVDIELPGGGQLPLFINHFKSMLGGRGPTMARRKMQALAVRDILEARFGADPGSHKFIVLGDLNDYLPSSGLEPLLALPWLENVVQTRTADEAERWTHYYDDDDEYRQLDYLLLSGALATANGQAVPRFVRRGMPKRAARAGPDRFEGVGWNRPKASDHCPVAIDLKV